MTDESQTSSGPGTMNSKSKFAKYTFCHCVSKLTIIYTCCLDSPHRGPADSEAVACWTAPDSSTVCATSFSVPHPNPEDTTNYHMSQTPCTSSGSHTQPSAAITSTSASHPPCSPPPVGSTPVQSPLSWSKPSSPSSSCPTMSQSPSPTATSCLGQRRKSLGRKVRRNQRQRGRQGSTSSARDEDRRPEEDEREEAGGEERMEEDADQDEERMEEEAHQQ